MHATAGFSWSGEVRLSIVSNQIRKESTETDHFNGDIFQPCTQVLSSPEEKAWVRGWKFFVQTRQTTNSIVTVADVEEML